mgnify:CR=1 FL=1
MVRAPPRRQKERMRPKKPVLRKPAKCRLVIERAYEVGVL